MIHSWKPLYKDVMDGIFRCKKCGLVKWKFPSEKVKFYRKGEITTKINCKTNEKP